MQRPSQMNLKSVHFASGLLLTLFIGLHLFNHACALFGAELHIAVMQVLRKLYRHTLVETVLLLAVATQIYSGLRLFFTGRGLAFGFFEKLQLWSGLYLAFFFMIHVGAVLAGRQLLGLDTNFYFGVAGLNTFPLNLFFVPYYGLAILSFFGHLAAIHAKKMKRRVLGLSPRRQAWLVLVWGMLFSALLLYGLTNQFQGVKIPTEYNLLELHIPAK